MSETINAFIEAVAQKNPNEPEFYKRLKKWRKRLSRSLKKIKSIKIGCFWSEW